MGYKHDPFYHIHSAGSLKSFQFFLTSANLGRQTISTARPENFTQRAPKGNEGVEKLLGNRLRNRGGYSKLLIPSFRQKIWRPHKPFFNGLKWFRHSASELTGQIGI